MKRFKRKYKFPKRPFDRVRIEAERKLMRAYGLRRKREVWKAEAILRKYRRLARQLAARPDPKLQQEFMNKLCRLGLIKETASLDDVLSLSVEDVLARRLQTVLHRKGLANTPKHARQLIVHGHVLIGGRKITYPSYLVAKAEEDLIQLKRG